MIRISVYKEIFESGDNRPFNVSIDKLQELNNGAYKTDESHPIISGAYIANERQCIAWELDNIRDEVLTKLNKEDTKILIFSHTYIDRELAEIEKQCINAVRAYAGLDEQEDKEIDLGKTLIQIADFKKAVNLLKDKEKFLKLIPFEPECIALAVLKDADEDIILQHEADFCSEIEAPNRNIFNIYIIDYTK